MKKITFILLMILSTSICFSNEKYFASIDEVLDSHNVSNYVGSIGNYGCSIGKILFVSQVGDGYLIASTDTYSRGQLILFQNINTQDHSFIENQNLCGYKLQLRFKGIKIAQTVIGVNKQLFVFEAY